MSRIIINIPDNCMKCPCFIEAKTEDGPNKKKFFLCRAFSKILTAEISRYGTMEKVNRCNECKDEEVFL